MEHNFTAYPENNVLVFRCECGDYFETMGDAHEGEFEYIRETIRKHREDKNALNE